MHVLSALVHAFGRWYSVSLITSRKKPRVGVPGHYLVEETSRRSVVLRTYIAKWKLWHDPPLPFTLHSRFMTV